MPVSRESSSCNHEAARLLPWLVAEALSEQEAQRVHEHMRDCPVCEADWKRELQLQSLLCDEPIVEHAPQPGLQKLMARIDELERELPSAPVAQAPLVAKPAGPVPHSRAPRAAVFGSRPMRWLAAAAIVQTIGLAVLGVLLWQRGAELRAPRFHTMSSVGLGFQGEARIRVVFTPSLPVGEMQTLLESVSATVVAGPSEAGVYTLALSGEQAAATAALATLRASPGVMFAEPLPTAERVE